MDKRLRRAVIEQERERYHRHVMRGERVVCRLCKRPAKIYKRKLNASMAMALILIYKYHQQHGWEKSVHVNSCVMSFGLPPRMAAAIRGDFTKLAHFWGMLEKRPGDRNDGNPRTGHWLIKRLGRKFVEDRIRVAAWYKEFRSVVVEASTETISIGEALAKSFNYRELMQSTPVSRSEWRRAMRRWKQEWREQQARAKQGAVKK